MTNVQNEPNESPMMDIDLSEYGGRDLDIDDLQYLHDRFVSKETCSRESENMAAALRLSSETDEKLRLAIESLLEKVTTIKDDHEKRITYQETCQEVAVKNLDLKIRKIAVLIGSIALFPSIAAIIITLVK